MTKCRLCGSSTESVIDLGEMYPSNFIPKNVDSSSYKKYPLKMVKCKECNLFQIDENPPLDDMYRQYWYKSSLNKSMVNALEDLVCSVQQRIAVYNGEVVVDIGANDGTTLSMYSKEVITVGFDPALNLKEEASSKCTHFINDYFSADKYPLDKKAIVVSAIACFYDLEQPHKFVDDVVKILDDDGIFVIQFTDLLHTLKINGFDNFVSEHLELYSFHDIVKLMKFHGLEVFDVETNDVNGGSIRAFIDFKGKRKVKDSVRELLEYEQDFMGMFEDPFKAFSDRVETIKELTVNFIKQEVAKGKKVFGLGASTKGNTLLSYFGFDSSLISYIAEVNKDKYGLKTIGTEIPIISEEEAFAMNPDYFLVLPWHFIDGFREKYKDYLNRGGKFIVPCPEFKIVTNSWSK